MVMIMNNLDPAVAQFPYELITYGGNGSVFSNWAQYHVIMRYLCDMTEEQTLTMFSGHPMGLFPSHRDAPRVVVTNGMVIPNYSSKRDYDRLYALGVTQYGQMTAGSYAYIGPQGIVHGTTITVLNAGRKYLGLEDLRGRVFVTSGLGGMSGAQGKAGVICGAVTVIAEVDRSALEKRHRQGWVQTVSYTLDDCIAKIRVARAEKKATSIAFLGNIVELWERLAAETDMLVDLGSDQTSLHNPFNGGYYPVQLGFEEAQKMMVADPPRFKQHVQESLRRHVKAINALCQRGMRFWDYGNSFLLEASRAGAEVMDASGSKFRYPSYVQDIMGDVFSLGFGPFRWICTSGLHEDLAFTDALAAQTIRRMQSGAAPRVLQQLSDNLLWIEHAEEHKLVVGSQARILYADARGRVEMAVAFNAAIRDGKVKGPIVLSRDHHDVSGTDSPFRETSDIYDGSSLCADMAVQNVIGDAFRGATWVSLHNGGGVGWGEVVNGGFGLVLDGSSDAERRARAMLSWDVNNGVARRAWAGNDNASFAVEEAMKAEPLLRVTIAQRADAAVLEAVIKAAEDDGRKLDRN
jgi:urocanate hydratase